MLAQAPSINIYELMNYIYPVNSIYMTVENITEAQMNSKFGGTWEKIKDRFLLASGDTYTNGSTGGEAEHKLTINELPSHTHKFNKGSRNYWSGNVINGYSTTASIFPGFVENNSSGRPDDYQEKTGCGKYFVYPTGAGNSHNNMPPYLVVNVFKRKTLYSN